MPVPLPVNDKRLRRSRYDVSVNGARNARGAYPFIASGRFATLESAQAWADEAHADAPNVRIVFLSALRGWQSVHVTSRRHGAWETTVREKSRQHDDCPIHRDCYAAEGELHDTGTPRG